MTPNKLAYTAPLFSFLFSGVLFGFSLFKREVLGHKSDSKKTKSSTDVKYHSFQDHYTHKIIIFKLFRSLQLQFSGPTRINFLSGKIFCGPDRNISLQIQFGTVT